MAERQGDGLRVRGYFTDGEPVRPMVRAHVALQRLPRSFAAVEWLIDTGAQNVILHPRDALKLGIGSHTLADSRQWSATTHLPGFGGWAEFYREPGVVAFASTDGSSHILDGTVYVATPEWGSRDFPSILGWDVLRHFRLTLDPTISLIELEYVGPRGGAPSR